METKICTKCGIEKLLIEFYKSSVHKNGKNSVCSECMRIYTKQYRKEHLEVIKIKNRKYILEHPDKYNNPDYHKSYREKNKDRLRITHLKWYLEKNFKLTLDQYNQMLKEQNGVCAICGKNETNIDGRSKKNKRLSVDHNHESGKIRELLCDKCNQGLGLFQENIDTLLNAINYLKKHKV